MRIRFRISTLLWLTLAIACFFAGMSWDDISESARLATATKKVASVTVNSSKTISLPSNSLISRISIEDPTVVNATLPSADSVRFTGQSEGTTKAYIWDDKDIPTEYSIVVKPDATATISFYLGFVR